MSTYLRISRHFRLCGLGGMLIWTWQVDARLHIGWACSDVHANLSAKRMLCYTWSGGWNPWSIELEHKVDIRLQRGWGGVAVNIGPTSPKLAQDGLTSLKIARKNCQPRPSFVEHWAANGAQKQSLLQKPLRTKHSTSLSSKIYSKNYSPRVLQDHWAFPQFPTFVPSQLLLTTPALQQLSVLFAFSLSLLFTKGHCPRSTYVILS